MEDFQASIYQATKDKLYEDISYLEEYNGSNQ